MFMPSVVTDFVKKNLVARIGPLATLMIVCGIVFAVGFMIDRLYLEDQDFFMLEGGPNFLYVVIVTAATAAGYYVLCVLLSSYFPKLQALKLWAVVVVAAVVAFVGVLLDGIYTGLLINEDVIIEWALRIIMAGGIAYLLADMNRIISGEGEPRLTRNMTLVVFLSLAAISAALYDLGVAFDDASTWLAGLLIGFIYGAAVSLLLFAALVESGGEVALEVAKPKAEEKPKPAEEKPKAAAAQPAPAVEEKPKAEAEKPKPAAKKPRAKKPTAAAKKPKEEAAEDKPEASEEKES
jgi:hypothetical protein